MNDKLKALIKERGAHIERMFTSGFSLDFDNLHFFSMNDSQYAINGVEITVSMNLFTAEELAAIIADVAGFKVTAGQIHEAKTANGEEIILKSNAKQHYSIYASEEEETMMRFSKKKGVTYTGHRFFRFTLISERMDLGF